MNKINVINYIEDKKYSVKEAIAYYKLTFEKINNLKRKISLDEFEAYLKCILVLHQFNNIIFDFVKCDKLALCKFYWEINMQDIIAYGDMLYLKLYLNKEVVTETDIINELNIVMRFYSPQNAVDAIHTIKNNLFEIGEQ